MTGSQKMFVRDPRELPFLREQAQRILELADKSSRGISLREDDDFGFMAIQFLYKQIQHVESVLRLIPSRDAGLVSRTMIEGLYQLLWTYRAPEERAKRWRSFSIILDWRLIQRRLREGIHVDDSDIRRTDEGIRNFGSLHQMNKPKPNSTDPYYKNWRGGVTVSDMADIVGRELYEGPYAELSDWEHWGVSGIGDAIVRDNDHVTINPDSERVSDLALLAAFQCLFQSLEIVNSCLVLGITSELDSLQANFIDTMGSFSCS
ncbi:MAG TPA: DUF5677 domain-containing protein [Acidobacteriaceae bacterium]|jgi:hypothetical protein